MQSQHLFVACLTALLSCSKVLSVENRDLSFWQNQVGQKVLQELETNFAGSSKVTLTIRSSEVAKNGLHLARIQQEYLGLPVLGATLQIVATPEGKLTRTFGTLTQGIDQDLKGHTTPTLTLDEALKQARSHHGKVYLAGPQSDWILSRVSTEVVIYSKVNLRKSHLAYRVEFSVDLKGGGYPARPVVIVDAHSGQVLSYWNALRNTRVQATGPGGNKKTGVYRYGTDYPSIEALQDPMDQTRCLFTSANVDTIDLKHATPVENSEDGETATPSNTPVHSFSCYENTEREVNGAYSAANDAHYFGNAIFQMYQDWLGVAPLKTKLTMRVHYGKDFSNAFWDGQQMTFGDGDEDFFPFVSLDIAAHEVSHGFTEFSSNLRSLGEPGGINEAFSDIAGEAAEFFMRGKTDFLVGADIMKKEEALRYLENPGKDGWSIDHISKFKFEDEEQCFFCLQLGGCDDICTDPHSSSGLYNKSFYIIAHSEGYDVKKAFQIFAKANKDYWGETTTFIEGAKAVLAAAQDLSLPEDPVRIAFKEVGIDLSL